MMSKQAPSLRSDARGAVSVEYLILAGCVALAVLGGFRQFGGEVAGKAFCQGQAVQSLSGSGCAGAPGGSESPFASVEIAGSNISAQASAEQDDACADGWRGALCRLADRGEDLVRDAVGHLPGGDFVADYAGAAWSLPDSIMQSVLPLFGAGGEGAPGVAETWTGASKQVAALGCAGIPGACSLLDSGSVPGFDQGEATQIQIDTGKSFVGWEHWANGEYGTAAGTLLPNVALVLAPGPKVSGLARASRVAAPDAPRGRPGEPGCVGSHCAVGSSQCFAAGTLVHTEAGLLPIENVQTDDLVWSRDEATGEVALRRVVQTFVNPTQPILDLSFEGEREALKVTYEHPFYTRDRGWVAAANLRIGEPVLRRTGELSRVVASHPARDRADVFNFEVEEFHTYFVGALGVWVHNQCSVPDAQAELDASWDAYRELVAKRRLGHPQDMREWGGYERADADIAVAEQRYVRARTQLKDAKAAEVREQERLREEEHVLEQERLAEGERLREEQREATRLRNAYDAVFSGNPSREAWEIINRSRRPHDAKVAAESARQAEAARRLEERGRR